MILLHIIFKLNDLLWKLTMHLKAYGIADYPHHHSALSNNATRTSTGFIDRFYTLKLKVKSISNLHDFVL